MCDAHELAVLSEPLRQPMSSGAVQLWTASAPAQALAQFAEHHPEVVVVAATLAGAGTAALIESVRQQVGRAEVSIVVLGDLTGPVTSALDAAELGADRFVARPISPKALRYAVAVSIDAARLARGGRAPSAPLEVLDDPTDAHGRPIGAGAAEPSSRASRRSSSRLVRVVREGQRQEQRARWARLADSIVNSGEELDEPELAAGAALAAGGISDAGSRPPRPSQPVVPARPARWGLPRVPDPSEQAEPLPPPFVVEPAPRQRVAAAPADDLADDPDDSLTDAPGDDEFDDELDDGFEEPGPEDSFNKLDSDLRARPARARDARDSGDLAPADDPVWSAPELLAQLQAVDAAPVVAPPSQVPAGREYARQLRQKMSEFAQRLFSNQDPAQLEAAPRHGHQIEFDLAALVEEPVLQESSEQMHAARTSATGLSRETHPGTSSTWDHSARDARPRQLPDAGEIVRGTCDAPAVVVRMWTLSATGRVVFRRGDVEKIVFFDRGRPVFASSTELHDRMGELLYREGKITHAQYMHSKSLVAESGRRMGEILVDLGYLKRRELYPAVRRHVEDIIYSVFAWDHGSYRISVEETASSERIRLSRHPEALVVEGIRRKLDRQVLERLVGAPSTVLELADRERVLSLASAIELTAEERAAIAAVDGHADLPAIARAAGLSITAVYPLAWALIVLGHAGARREGGELADGADEPAVAGESDLAIDRERVRARWLLVADADYFTLLGVRRDATSFEIRRAYEASRRDFAAEGFALELRRELARELDDIATVLEEAFRVLRDDSLRRQYLAHLVD